jgi:hypothetical protein
MSVDGYGIVSHNAERPAAGNGRALGMETFGSAGQMREHRNVAVPVLSQSLPGRQHRRLVS